tara:strand:- start:62 stop:385 length:324 start_codon:yes stop_codon:yes gene_type:complete
MSDRSGITIIIPREKYIQFKARLLYDKIRVSSFMRSIIEMYLENDEQIIKIVSRIKEDKGIDSKVKREKNVNLVEKSKEISALFNLDHQEIKNLYDILEDEDKDEEM